LGIDNLLDGFLIAQSRILGRSARKLIKETKFHRHSGVSHPGTTESTRTSSTRSSADPRPLTQVRVLSHRSICHDPNSLLMLTLSFLSRVPRPPLADSYCVFLYSLSSQYGKGDTRPHGKTFRGANSRLDCAN